MCNLLFLEQHWAVQSASAKIMIVYSGVPLDVNNGARLAPSMDSLGAQYGEAHTMWATDQLSQRD